MEVGTEGGGGGGAGGYLTSPSLTVTPGQKLSIVIGAGGTGGPFSPADGGSTWGTNGTNSGVWSSSPFPSIWATGGGGGASYRGSGETRGFSGGSGGGGTIVTWKQIGRAHV